ncbi:MAG: phosphocarrier protein HPr [Phycisphaerae bacterium]|nr:phosphocarrier protein HPr [Phycisphaerae bacterium]
MQEARVTIQNKLGLHARPATAFVTVAQEFQSSITVRRSDADELIDGKSIMMLMMLGATKGTELVICTEGSDDTEAIKALVQLVMSNFDEE